MQITSHFTANGLLLEKFPFNSELAMAGFLADNPSILSLDDDFYHSPKFLDHEIKIGDGRLDLLIGYGEEQKDDYKVKAIVECKKTEIKIDHVAQLQRYFEERVRIDSNPNVEWLGLLVGTSINEELRRNIIDGKVVFDNGGGNIAALVVNRFKGGNQIYTFTETYINLKKATKDFTKYNLWYNNSLVKENLAKSRLVLEVLKHYTSENPSLSFDILKQKFPKNIQGSLGVFDEYQNAKNFIEVKNKKVYYIYQDPNNHDESEVISLEDGTQIAACNQWGITNIPKFIEKAENLGYTIEIAIPTNE